MIPNLIEIDAISGSYALYWLMRRTVLLPSFRIQVDTGRVFIRWGNMLRCFDLQVQSFQHVCVYVQ